MVLEEWDVSLATNCSILALLWITIRIEAFLTEILHHPLDSNFGTAGQWWMN